MLKKEYLEVLIINFNHLVLLIGTNPLPNLVVAEYFLRNNPELKEIWLVHSEKTDRQKGTGVLARNLEEILQHDYKSKIKFPLHKIPLSNVSDAKQIVRDLKDDFFEKLSSKSSVHLNYTGGTKVMGVHVYRAIEENIKISEKSFSYINSREYQVVDDEQRGITDDLRKEINITFSELIKLHGYKRINSDSDFDFTIAVETFKTNIEENLLNKYFEYYKKKRYLFTSRNRSGKLAEHINELKDELKRFKPNNTFLSIIKAMPDGCRFFSEDENFMTPHSDNECKNAIKFIDGGWLEDYIYYVLKKNLKDYGFEILKNWEIKKDKWNTNFELDVILMQGYQLIGISCTTSNMKARCKSKGFEIIHRTRQIGGAEAKAILVTMMDKDKKTKADLRPIVQEELEIDTGGTASNILVLGERDLQEKQLLDKIKIFLK